MPVARTDDSVQLTHPKGPTVTVLLYGATIVSWKVPEQSNTLLERLFVSSKAALDGSKPVRGGIPVVFPCFGPPSHPDHSKLPQHGLARNHVWNFANTVMDNEAGVSVRFELDSASNEKIRQLYEKPFHLTYTVTLAEHQLSTDLHVENKGDGPFEFQALLHTYIRAPADDVQITPLHDLSYYDKTEANPQARDSPKTETRAVVGVRNFTDSIYENGPLNYHVRWPGGGLDVRARHFKDVVVWNPQDEGKKIGDMEDNGWKQFVCVEPGYVRGFVTVAPGEVWTGQQVLTVVQAPTTAL